MGDGPLWPALRGRCSTHSRDRPRRCRRRGNGRGPPPARITPARKFDPGCKCTRRHEPPSSPRARGSIRRSCDLRVLRRPQHVRRDDAGQAPTLRPQDQECRGSSCEQEPLLPAEHEDAFRSLRRSGRPGSTRAVRYARRRGSEAGRAPTRTVANSSRAKTAFGGTAIEAYASDNGGYAGMTLAGLQRWDSTVTDIRIVWATRASYCIESGTDPDTSHKAGPGASIEPGPCPPAPA
jgi:hypothetical protein